MLNRVLTFVLISGSVCAAVSAQQTPLPIEPRTPRVFFESSMSESYLGVQTQEVTKENYARFGLREVRGVAVEKVLENSPAAQAGLQATDVIIRFNGEDVTGTRKLTRLISEVAPDHQARLTILRGGGEREITATIGKREITKLPLGGLNLGNLSPVPSFPREPLAPNARVVPFGEFEPGVPLGRIQARRQIGVGVTELTEQLGSYFGTATGKGLLINNVRENSPAAKAGLKAGDIIVEIDGKQVGESVDLIRVLNEKKDGDVTLTIVRDRNRQTMRVTPEAAKGEVFNFNGELEKLGRDLGDEPMRFEFKRLEPLHDTPAAPPVL